MNVKPNEPPRGTGAHRRPGSFRRFCGVTGVILASTVVAALAAQVLIARRAAEGTFVTAVPLPATLAPDTYVFAGSAAYGFDYRQAKDVHSTDQVLLPPFQALRPGVWFMDRAARGHWSAAYVVSAVGNGQVEAIAHGERRAFPFRRIELLSDSERLTHFPLLLVASTVALAFIGGVVAVFRRASAALKEYEARRPQDLGAARSAGPPDEAADVLRCPNCGAPVPLPDAETTACTYCEARVAVPEVVRQFTRSHAHLYAQADAELRELHAERRFSFVFGVGALGLGLGPIVALPLVTKGAFSLLAKAMADFGWTVWVFLGPLVALGGLVFVVSGVLIEGVRRDFVAVSAGAGRGFECRVCGAALTPRQAGLAQPCLRCAAQNILPTALRAATERARSTTRSITVAMHERRAKLCSNVMMVAWPVVAWGAPIAGIFVVMMFLLALIMV